MSAASQAPRGRGLHAVSELRPYEVHVGALTDQHVGLTVAVRRGLNVLTGPLDGVPTESMTRPLLVLDVGDFSVALHPTAVVTVVPDNARLTITVAPKRKAVAPPSARETALRTVASSSRSVAAVGDAVNGHRSIKLLPGRFRNRRKCHCRCGGKQSHGGYADGIAMTAGCEWSMRYWVNHGQLPLRETLQK
ncbi:hypothetical protein BKG82_26885 [Mycobacteroides chelonae]|uniref:Uncharacterized protein n=1 Tax=Mycobacteroides chelonae TaxID=1774 RepID=A0A1S1LHL1_MYCCH|nr:hypothetical protein [Mycobacteroides chelonae]OHU47279.1 hypothetical protein BKG82_26885 [Mycobacteroides chelonae]